jgi:hypothetical protein
MKLPPATRHSQRCRAQHLSCPHGLQGSAGWVQQCNPVPAKPTQHRCNAPGMSEQGGLQKACCGLAPPPNPPANATAPQ